MGVRRKLLNAMWELRLGISTRGLHFSELSDNEHIHYGTQSYTETVAVLKALRLDLNDVFVDLGCGKGRVICLAARHLLREVIGVEHSAYLCEIARRNSLRVRGRRSPIKIQEIGAESFDYTIGTVFYMFHSFGPKTLASVLERMYQGLRSNPRRLRLVYSNPRNEHIVSQVGWLERCQLWTKETHDAVQESVSFWRSKM